MATSSCTLLLLLLAVRGSIQKSSPESWTYRAGVVEFKAIKYTNDSAATSNANADKIISFIEQAAQREVDIVVFPELALNSMTSGPRASLISRSTLIPDPSQHYAPCTDSSIPVVEAVKKIACAVERNGIYVVVNLLEKELCSLNNCREDGFFLYLTSVVFDRQGKIISRARKSHLLNDPDVYDAMKTSGPSTFDTDFGVTFGNIVCFDILFENVLLTLTRKHNITDVVHASGWYSTMPFQTTIQVVTGWAYAEDINLLSSGYNNIDWGDSGSGIHGGRQGVLSAVFSLDHHDELLVADVRKKSKNNAATSTVHGSHVRDLGPASKDEEHYVQEELGRKSDSNGFKWRYDGFDGFQTELISENGFSVERLNQNGIDCEFRVNVTNFTNPPGVTYRLVAFDDAHAISTSLVLGNRICAIVLCANETVDSCGHTLSTSVIFNFIEITASYVDNERTIMMPNTLGSDIMPLKNFTWEQRKQEDRVYTSISLTRPTQNLVTFGFWGRNFEKDRRSGNRDL